jgi:uncharacterized membrane protein YgcG
MSAIPGEPDGVRPQQTSAVGQLTPRDWVVVAAGAVAVIGTFLPWYGFSLPTVSYSVSGFSAHGPVPMAPLTLVPALSGLVAAGQRLLPLVRSAGAGAPAGSKKSLKKTEPWWPQAQPPPADPDDAPPSPVVPPASWLNPVLQTWALLTMVLYLFIDTSESGHRSGYWLTFVATILIPVFGGGDDGSPSTDDDPTAQQDDATPDDPPTDDGDGDGDGDGGGDGDGDDGQKGLTRTYDDPVEPGDGDSPPDDDNDPPSDHGDDPPDDHDDPPDEQPPDDVLKRLQQMQDRQGRGKAGKGGKGGPGGPGGDGSGGKGKAGGGGAQTTSGVLPAVAPVDRGALADLLRNTTLPSRAFVRAFLHADLPVTK